MANPRSIRVVTVMGHTMSIINKMNKKRKEKWRSVVGKSPSSYITYSLRPRNVEMKKQLEVGR